MYIVAITRWKKPFEPDLPALSRLSGIAVADVRLRCARPLPIALCRAPDAQIARNIVAEIRKMGHGAMECDADEVIASSSMFFPKTFAFEEEAIMLEDQAKRTRRLTHPEIMALVHAALTTEEQKTISSTEKKFSAGRAILTGGIMLTKKVEKIRQETAEEYEQVLYIYPITCEDPILLRQNHILYSGLKDKIGRSSMESFANLIAALRRSAPGALYDNSLLLHRRKADITYQNKSGSVKSVERSNASETDLAAYVIALARFHNQL